jgi:hypothetical protein
VFTEILIFTVSFWAVSKLLVDIKIGSLWSLIPAAIVYLVVDKTLTISFAFILSVLPIVPAFILEWFILPSASWIAFKVCTGLVSDFKVESGAGMFWGIILVSVFSTVLQFLFM